MRKRLEADRSSFDTTINVVRAVLTCLNSVDRTVEGTALGMTHLPERSRKALVERYPNKFKNDDNRISTASSTDIGLQDHQSVHVLAHAMGVKHKLEGKGSNRFVEVTKRQ